MTELPVQVLKTLHRPVLVHHDRLRIVLHLRADATSGRPCLHRVDHVVAPP
jgi:hypothetical protein